MKKLLALLLGAAVLCMAGDALAVKVLTNTPLRWRTTASAAFTDSAYFSEAGTSNATRDTSAWVSIADIAPSNSSHNVADSTLWLRVNIYPLSGASTTPAMDSLYVYVQGIGWQGTTVDLLANPIVLTNMQEVLCAPASTAVNPTSTSNLFATYFFSWGRTATGTPPGGLQSIRVIVRGDMNGQFQGDIAYWTEAASKSR